MPSESSPMDPLFRLQQQYWSETWKFWTRMMSAPKVLETAARFRLEATPHDVVHELGTLRLLHYRRDTPASVREPVLVCYALVNRPYILDLQPDRSVVRQLLARGLDVYLIDWGVPTDSDRHLHLHDYVCDRLHTVAEVVRRRAEVEQFHLLGYCMGGTMSTMFTCLFPELVRNLILLAAPIDFSGDECLLHVWAQEKYFDVDRLIDAFGNCPATLLQAAFQLMKPVPNFIEKYLGFNDHMHDEKYLENFFAMEKWTSDNIPVAGETFREFVKWLYQQNQLVRGELVLRGQPVQLERIACPLLLLTADFDHLVLPQSTLGILPHVKSVDVKHLNFAAGHVGLAVSSRAHKTLWPAATDWIANHATAK